MKKIVLQIEEDQNLPSFAIHSPLKGYRLAYLLNRKWNASFEKITHRKQLEIYRRSQAQEPFEVFRWNDEKHLIKCILIKNQLWCSPSKNIEKSKETLFSPAPKQYFIWRNDCKKADYILEFESFCSCEEIDRFHKCLVQIPDISFVQRL